MNKIIIDSTEKFNIMEELINKRISYDPKICKKVRDIVYDVQKRKDKALLEYTKKFDKVKLQDILVSESEIQNAKKIVVADIKDALDLAKKNIENFQKRFKKDISSASGRSDLVIDNIVRPLDRVGVYVPGGRAPLVSTVLMTVIPAKTAGVSEVVVVTPPGKDGSINPNILYACDLCGVDKIFKSGGAQAIAAFAFGTETIPKVDKIVGPGNIYVTLAKKEVYGYVDIDMIAGPSEILVFADDKVNPEWVATDLMSQAEHDPMACAFLVCFSEDYADRVIDCFSRQMNENNNREVIKESWEKNGKIFIVDNMQDALKVINMIAPEHLELMIEDPYSILDDIKNAGAVFMGQYTPEAIGDYVAGPSHVLPTGGSARYFSVLSPSDFYKNMSVISYNKELFDKSAKAASDLASLEGLEAHAKSIEIRSPFQSDIGIKNNNN